LIDLVDGGGHPVNDTRPEIVGRERRAGLRPDCLVMLGEPFEESVGSLLAKVQQRRRAAVVPAK
jgi:hypothetical protein